MNFIDFFLFTHFHRSDEAAGKFGAGAHCDWGTWTLLATDSIPGWHNHDLSGTCDVLLLKGAPNANVAGLFQLYISFISEDAGVLHIQRHFYL